MDRTTISDFINGSQRAFARIFLIFSPKVLRLGRQIFRDEEIAQDFAQDLMTRVWEHREKFREVEDFELYLWKMAWNLAYTRQKTALSRTHLQRRYVIESEKPVHNDLEHHFTDSDYTIIIERALATTTPRRQLIFKLSREKGLSQKEIALQLNLAKQTVDNEMTSTLKTIRVHLRAHQAISVILAFSTTIFF